MAQWKNILKLKKLIFTHCKQAVINIDSEITANIYQELKSNPQGKKIIPTSINIVLAHGISICDGKLNIRLDHLIKTVDISQLKLPAGRHKSTKYFGSNSFMY